jgi:transglutaminase-like putative cysteine protease
MKALVFIILMMASTAIAQNASPKILTSNSRFEMTGVVPVGTRWLLVEVKKDGEASFHLQTLFWPVLSPSGAALPSMVLARGPGTYTIHVFATDGASYVSDSYKFLATYEVVNSDPTERLFLADSLEIQSSHPDVRALASKLTASAETDLDRARAVHAWVTANVAYDQARANDRTYDQVPGDALSVLRSKLAVCGGYANLTAALHRALGMKARVVVGKLIGQREDKMTVSEICQAKTSFHAWNEVLVEGRWINIDTTLDAGYEDGNTRLFVRSLSDRYFDTPPGLFALTHIKCWEELK